MADRIWRCGTRALLLDRPLVMGVVNVTPDSFYDGGETADPLSALARGRELAAAGADIIDVGGESTRPGAAPVDPAEEIARVRPVISALLLEDLCVSVDTRHARVASACADAGVHIINDVAGFRDRAMVKVAASCDAGLVVMHMGGEPATMQDAPVYDDVVADVRDYLERQAFRLRDAGVARDRIALDPGIGFGKTLEHNLELLRRLGEIAALGYPVVVGTSRKRFIGTLLDEPDVRRRLWGSVGAAVAATARGAAVVRVHDVGETVQALKVAHAIDAGEAAW
ncbi:MAG: dihydropteroate synthase [Coriobacteriia bacterium]|nr:dihydropteroate synthase [Coriobacteriia bacterium]